MTQTVETTKQTVKTVLWQALTPIHAGTGQTSSSVIDLPILREGATGYPILPASSIKGVLRGGREGLEAFGYANKETTEGGDKKKVSKAADLTFTDARILCLPVRSYKGTFALVSCPLVLSRLERDRRALGLSPLLEEIPKLEGKQAQVTNSSVLKHGSQLILEDLDLMFEQGPIETLAQNLASLLEEGGRAGFLERFALISDDAFDFFSQTATEVTARVALEEDTKTVKLGGLWYEEAVPAETLFTSFVLSQKGDFSELERAGYLQLGGKASVGKGLLKSVLQ